MTESVVEPTEPRQFVPVANMLQMGARPVGLEQVLQDVTFDAFAPGPGTQPG